AMGARALQRWLTRPLRDASRLGNRYDAVAALLDDAPTDGHGFERLRDALKPIADVERILARIALRSARPRDLLGLGHSLQQLPALQAALPDPAAPLLRELLDQLGDHEATA